MNYQELQAQIAQRLRRSDLSSRIPMFVQDATERINRRLNLQLVNLSAPDDTNEILTSYPLLYIYAALQSGYEQLNDGTNAVYFADRWELECDRQYVTQSIDDPLVMEPSYGT